MDPVSAKFYTVCVIHRLSDIEGKIVLHGARTAGVLSLPLETERQRLQRHRPELIVDEDDAQEQVSYFVETIQISGLTADNLAGDWEFDLNEYRQVFWIVKMYGVVTGFPEIRDTLIPLYIASLPDEESWKRDVLTLMRAREDTKGEWGLDFWERFGYSDESFHYYCTQN